MDPQILKILVPIDFSEASERAAAYAAALAGRLGASIHLVHVLESSMFNRRPYDYEPAMPAVRERLYQEARARLIAVAARVASGTSRVSVEVRHGDAQKSITAAEIDYGADLVIMSTHGRSGWSHLLLGSVAEQLIRTARCPVLVIRDSDQVHALKPQEVESLQLA
jgi:nucleotide-binding universal stress UspA family protein